jgi:hypothetical protein
MTSRDALKCLLAGYLHEDFMIVHGSAWGAVEDYAHDQVEFAPQLHGQIADLLEAFPSESSLEAAVSSLGLNYLPAADGWTSYRSWLLAVADRVDAIVRTSPAA